ncbi:hypothetical protein CXG81DRAFT_12201, partial [Caulochytrium protostelioides]
MSNAYNKWTPEEDALLRAGVALHGTTGKWPAIASMIAGRSAVQCSTRWSGALNTTIIRGKWRREDDAILREAYAEQFASLIVSALNWQKVADRVPGRTSLQCMARYQETLDPRIRKGKWDAWEDELLVKGLHEHGKSWIKISTNIPGRTQRQCRTRWLQL